MKFNAVATAIAMATMVAAQNVADVPACAIPCLDKAVKSQTTCGATEFACICKKENFSKIQNHSSSCVIEKCGPEKAVNEVLPASQKLCSQAQAGKNNDGSKYPPSSHADKPTGTGGSDYKPTHEPAPATTNCPPTDAPNPEPSGHPNGDNGNGNGTAQPTTAAVTAGAAGFAPVGGLAMLALGALAL